MAKKQSKPKEAKELKGRQLLDSLEEGQMKSKVTKFNVGDTVEVGVKIQEGDKERVQIFTGVCIARKGSSARETFTVRRIVSGEGVERVFPLHSPNVASIKVVRRGKVRRAKLHYLRERTGRATKVREKLPGAKEKEEQE